MGPFYSEVRPYKPFVGPCMPILYAADVDVSIALSLSFCAVLFINCVTKTVLCCYALEMHGIYYCTQPSCPRYNYNL